MNMINKIVLGSSSPRRQEILSMLGLPYEVVSPDADERLDSYSSPEEYVMTIAGRKCDAVADELARKGKYSDDTLIVSCDTIVYYDKMIIGKPKDDLHAKVTLGMLADSWHIVYSGLVLRLGEKTVSDFCATRVKFADVSESEIDSYVASGEPRGKAGSYAAQMTGAALVERIDGDFFNVMGLPVSTFCALLKSSFYTDVYELSKHLGGKS